MITCQHEWIKQCQLKYRWELLPEGEHWEDAHYPEPECRNGIETVRLWSRDHAVHGVLQSEDLNHPCLHGFRTHKDRLLISEHYPEYLDLYNKWRSNLSSLSGKKGAEKTHAERDELGRSVQGVKNAERLNASMPLEQKREYGRRGAEIVHKEKDEFGRSLQTLKMHKEKDEFGRSIQGIENAERLHAKKDEFGRSVQGVENAKRMHAEKDDFGRSVNVMKAHSKKDEFGRSVLGVENAKKMHAKKDENGKSVASIKGAAASHAQKWRDPDHPELGEHSAGTLALKQKSRGYSHGKENRVRV
jgi:hypothetical protein